MKNKVKVSFSLQPQPYNRKGVCRILNIS